MGCGEVVVGVWRVGRCGGYGSGKRMVERKVGVEKDEGKKIEAGRRINRRKWKRL